LAQRYLIQFSIDHDKKFLNWLRTSCVVTITTEATWHIWTGPTSNNVSSTGQ